MQRFVLCILLASLLLTGCGTPAPVAVGEPYMFRSGETALTVGDDMATVLSALGEPKSYFEAPSCAFEGLDKTYTYPGFVITTQPEEERDVINSVVLTDDSVATPEGVYIGCTSEDVRGVYGEPAKETDTALSYHRSGVALRFILEDGKVCAIEYLPV